MAWISPCSKLRSTAFNAWVASKLLSSFLRTSSGAPDAPLPASLNCGDDGWVPVEAIDCIGRRLSRDVTNVSLDLGIEQLLRTLRAPIGLGDEIGAGVDVGGNLLA